MVAGLVFSGLTFCILRASEALRDFAESPPLSFLMESESPWRITTSSIVESILWS